MVEPAAAIEQDLRVYTADGETLGTITQVWPQADDQTSGRTTAGYFTVQGGGVLGIGGTYLYLPFAAIDDVVVHERVTVRWTKDECEHRYTETPNVLTGRR
jgi:hypothetical protein